MKCLYYYTDSMRLVDMYANRFVCGFSCGDCVGSEAKTRSKEGRPLSGYLARIRAARMASAQCPRELSTALRLSER